MECISTVIVYGEGSLYAGLLRYGSCGLLPALRNHGARAVERVAPTFTNFRRLLHCPQLPGLQFINSSML